MNICRKIKRCCIRLYHDKLYGFPIHDDDELFCRLVLEINQAGLSWETILKKETTFRKAYDHFDLKKVAAYSEADTERLLANPGIIRNRLKINAAIENAKTILQLQKEYVRLKNGWSIIIQNQKKNGCNYLRRILSLQAEKL